MGLRRRTKRNTKKIAVGPVKFLMTLQHKFFDTLVATPDEADFDDVFNPFNEYWQKYATRHNQMHPENKIDPRTFYNWAKNQTATQWD